MKNAMTKCLTPVSLLKRKNFALSISILATLFAVSAVGAQAVPYSVARMHIDRGLTQMAAGRMEFARNEFEFVLLYVEDPDLRSIAYLNTGVLTFLEGNANQAIKYYQSAIQLSPDYAEAYFNLGGCYYKLGDLRRAEEAFLEAVRLQPTYGRAHYSLGTVYFDQKKYDLAQKHAAKAEEYGVPYKTLKERLAKVGNRP